MLEVPLAPPQPKLQQNKVMCARYNWRLQSDSDIAQLINWFSNDNLSSSLLNFGKGGLSRAYPQAYPRHQFGTGRHDVARFVCLVGPPMSFTLCVFFLIMRRHRKTRLSSFQRQPTYPEPTKYPQYSLNPPNFTNNTNVRVLRVLSLLSLLSDKYPSKSPNPSTSHLLFLISPQINVP
jgi:hypothetical protein